MSVKRLGKGIEAIISSKSSRSSNLNLSSGNLKISLSSIIPNPNQPRNYFDQTSLLELAKSIKIKGIITPITVHLVGDKYEIIAGERRYRAAKLSKLKKIPAYIIKLKKESEMMEVALIENIQRQDLNPLEEAEGYAVLNSKYGMSHELISTSVGKKRTTISNFLRLLKLPPEIKTSIREGGISAGHGRALLQLKSVHAMKKMWNKIIRQNLSVRSAELLVKNSAKNKTTKKINKKKEDLSSKAIENQLIEVLGTKVSLRSNNVGGSIEITYYSNDDLERILDLLNSL